LRYKAALAGITIFFNEESCTSKTSFLYLDDIPVYHLRVKHTFSAKPIKGAWYKAKDGKLIHADVNVRYIIIRKVVPDA
jgi:putative transposase